MGIEEDAHGKETHRRVFADSHLFLNLRIDRICKNARGLTASCVRSARAMRQKGKAITVHGAMSSRARRESYIDTHICVPFLFSFFFFVHFLFRTLLLIFLR